MLTEVLSYPVAKTPNLVSQTLPTAYLWMLLLLLKIFVPRHFSLTLKPVK